MHEAVDAIPSVLGGGGLVAVAVLVFRLFLRTDTRREDLLDRYERRIAELERELEDYRKAHP